MPFSSVARINLPLTVGFKGIIVRCGTAGVAGGHCQLEIRTIPLNLIKFAIVAVAVEDPGEFDDFGLLVDRVHDPVLALGHAEAREAFVGEMG
jgi:hypothetical protein